MQIGPSQLERISSCSAYLGSLLRNRENYIWLAEQGRLLRGYALVELFQELQTHAGDCTGLQELHVLFRDFKQKHFLRIAGRECLGWAGIMESTQQLSDLAAVCLRVGLESLSQRPGMWLGQQEAEIWKGLRSQSALAVLGLGKLGGYELNYVSDIDLFLLRKALDKQKEDSKIKPLQNKLCQNLASLLGDQVQGDRVFKVDLRLRPGGREGELVSGLNSALDYYQLRGRSWERQALLKARAVAGDKALGNEFLQQVRPFVFRRFLDFQALGELQAMRDRILKETSRLSQDADIKLGPGGIREIEFLVQSLQLVYGGRYPELQEVNTLSSLKRLRKLQILPAQAQQELSEDYVFLRRVEHWIQLDQNRQSSKVPDSEGARQRLALALGYAGDAQSLLQGLQKCRQRVHEHFQALFQTSSQPKGQSRAFNAAGQDAQDLNSKLLELWPGSGQQILQDLQAAFPWQDSQQVNVFQSRIKDFLQQLQSRPGLAQALDQTEVLVNELLLALGQSAIVHALLRAQPGLAEGLLQQKGSQADFWSGCRKLLQGCASFEEALEWIRRCKNERILSLALQDLQGEVSGSSLEEELTQVAGFTLQETYSLLLRHMGLDEGLPLAVLALGRAGSREMGYLSDLDLVFVYDPPSGQDQDLIPEQVVRFIQRLMRMLSTPLQEGPGYVVDARLRPTGNYGPLVSTRRSWQEYYSSQADIWEIQALLRLRCVAGSRFLGRELENFAANAVFQSRKQKAVWPRLCSLRRRMLQERARENEDLLQLKLGQGGLVELEFLAQGAQLIFGAQEPGLRSANIRSILPQGLQALEVPGGSYLEAAFSLYRALERRLQHLSNSTSASISQENLQQMQALGLWPVPDQALGLEGWQDLLQIRRRVNRAWQGVCREFA